MQTQAEMQKLQMEAQLRKQEAEFQAQLKQQENQMKMQVEQHKQEMQAQENALRNQLEHERAIADREMELKINQMKLMTERNTQLMLAHINNGAKIEVARIGADKDDGEIAYANEEEMAQAMEHPMKPFADAITNSNGQIAMALSELANKMSAPKTKRVVRDQNGKILGVQEE